MQVLSSDQIREPQPHFGEDDFGVNQKWSILVLWIGRVKISVSQGRRDDVGTTAHEEMHIRHLVTEAFL